MKKENSIPVRNSLLLLLTATIWGVAFVAQPQIPPRNVNWSSSGKWVHAAKVGFEKYFLHKVKSGKAEPFYERMALKALGIDKLKAVEMENPGAGT